MGSAIDHVLRLPTLLSCALVLGSAGACADREQASAVVGGGEEPPAVEADDAWTARTGGPGLFDHVTDGARRLAARPYSPPDAVVPPEVARLSYGRYRGIRFRDEAALWRGAAPFEVQLFHPGGGFDTPVSIHVVDGDTARPVAFDPARFDYGDELDGVDMTVPPSAGHAGFRVLYRLNDPARLDEVVTFLGASYFRLLGPGHVYGLSGRGLAVDVAEPTGEEFPDFRAFWLVRPDSGDAALTFYGLLDGPSVTGAYRFELTPGAPGRDAARPTELAVEARLFARADVRRLGVAPLTSMYLHGTFRPGGNDDVRPRVHDSEGLQMLTAKGEWIWRPLSNGPGVRVTSLRDIDPRGYGLAQRDRDFEHYLDLEARYHRRPSLWVEPADTWGPGGVELVELPSPSEFNDNIVAYWRPDAPLRAGQERTFRYRLRTYDVEPPVPGASDGPARVVRTRIGWNALPGQVDPPPRTQRRVVLDFAGGGLDTIPPAGLDPVVGASAGTVHDVRVLALPGGGRRVTFALDAEADRASDMRVFLTAADVPVTETWSYLWDPADVR